MTPPTFNEVLCVGMHFRGEEAKELASALLPDDELTLEREPFNMHDENAIKVSLREHWIGYIQRQTAAFLASYMDEGTQYRAVVTGHKGQYPVLDVMPVTEAA